MEVKLHSQTPSHHFSPELFKAYWIQKIPTVRISKQGSDYCDTWNNLMSHLYRLPPLDRRKYLTVHKFSQHKHEALDQFKLYNERQEMLKSESDVIIDDSRHVMFDFSKNVLLLL